MITTVDEQGRLELPPQVTAQLGLKPGDRVLVEAAPGHCILRPERALSGLRWEGNVLVHEGVGVVPSLAELHEQRLNCHELTGGHGEGVEQILA